MNYRAKFMIMDATANISEETEWIVLTRPEKLIEVEVKNNALVTM